MCESQIQAKCSRASFSLPLPSGGSAGRPTVKICSLTWPGLLAGLSAEAAGQDAYTWALRAALVAAQHGSWIQAEPLQMKGAGVGGAPRSSDLAAQFRRAISAVLCWLGDRKPSWARGRGWGQADTISDGLID